MGDFDYEGGMTPNGSGAWLGENNLGRMLMEIRDGMAIL
jgi:predicted NAD-dependent protein-ADP-ribosyltransferase YbiA (DUF1768 family)